MQTRWFRGLFQASLFLLGLNLSFAEMQAGLWTWFGVLELPARESGICLALIVLLVVLCLDLIFWRDAQSLIGRLICILALAVSLIFPWLINYLPLWYRPWLKTWPKTAGWLLFSLAIVALKAKLTLLLICLISLLIELIYQEFTKYKAAYYSSADQLNSRLLQITDDLSQARLVQTQTEQLIRNDERGRIAGVLHDSLGHSLASGLLQAQALKINTGRILAGSDQWPKLERSFDNLVNSLQAGMEDTRKNLHQINEEAFDLEEKICQLDQLVPGKKLAFNLHFSQQLNLQLSLDILAFCRIGVANFYQHSKGDRLNVIVTEQVESVYLKLQDNGCRPKEIELGREGIYKLPRHSLGMGLNKLERLAEKYQSNLICGWRDEGFILSAKFNRGNSKGGTQA